MNDNKERITYYRGQEKISLIKYLTKTIKEIIIYRFTYYNFITSMLSARYRRSILGFFWTLINPLINLSILAFIFSLVFKQDIRTFGVYVFSALSPWTFLQNCMVLSPNSFIQAESYLKKVYLPKILFPLTLVSVEIINFFFSLISIYIIFLVIGAKISWVMILIPFAMLIIFIFGLGIALIFSVIQVYFRDMFQIVSVLVGALIYTIPVIYPLDFIPQLYRPLIFINPFFQYINLFRAIIYDGRVPVWNEWLVPLLISIITLLIGCVCLKTKENDMVFRL